MGKRPARVAGRILSPERFNRFVWAAFNAKDQEMRLAARGEIEKAYAALYGSRYGRLWTGAQKVVETGFEAPSWLDHSEAEFIQVPRRSFRELRDAVALLREHDDE